MIENWRGTYAARFNERVLLDRPQPAPVYRRLSDEEIALLPEGIRGFLMMSRALHDSMAKIGPMLLRRPPQPPEVKP